MTNFWRSLSFLFSTCLCAGALAQSVPSTRPAGNTKVMAIPLSSEELELRMEAAKTEALRWKDIVTRRPDDDLLSEVQKLVDPGKEAVQSSLTGSSTGSSAPQFDLQSIKTVVFISLSMPERTLRALLNQGSGRDDTMFVLRGWSPPNMQGVLERLAPMIDKREAPPTVMFHPEAFRLYKVSQVPVVLHKTKAGPWRRTTGEISLDGAIEEIERGPKAFVGPTWKVEEPDILEIIEERARKFDWEGTVRQARQRAYDRMFDGIQVPSASVTSNTSFDPSIVVDKDVRDPQGRLIVARGTVVNPLDHQPFSAAVIAIDPYDQKQLVLAQQWINEYPNSIVFVTRNAIHSDGRPTWAVLGKQTYPLNESYLNRFGIKAVPSLVRQFGKRMMVHTEAVAQ